MIRLDMDNGIIRVYHTKVHEVCDNGRLADAVINALRRDAEGIKAALLFSPLRVKFDIVEIMGDGLD